MIARSRFATRTPSRALATVAVAALLLSLAGLVACGPGAEVEPPPDGTPKLVVFLVSDQFRADYLERGRDLYTGGLARLMERGVSFTAAHHAHAVSNTAPGHAALSTGVYPAGSGIVGNGWFDRESGESVYCVEDAEHGISPANLRVPTLGDWLRERYPESRVVAASGKDRGAVLTGGHRADAAFWYDREEGGFTTSTYYLDEIPEWLQSFNEEWPVDVFGGGWRQLEVDEEAAAEAGFEPFDRGPFEHGFPHLVGGLTMGPDEDFWYGLYGTPEVDAWLGRLAATLVEEYELGEDEWPDFLGLSFSAVDTVGHPYGPNSPEVLDTLLRLDRVLGELFDHLDRTVGEGNYVVSFSGDHGVQPLPEVLGPPARRADLESVSCLRAAGGELVERYGEGIWLGEGLYMDTAYMEEEGLELAEVLADLEALVEECPGMLEVWTQEELAASPAPAGPLAPGTASWYEALHRNAVYPPRSPDALVQVEQFFTPYVGGLAVHGSPYAYDTHVPFVLMAPTLNPGQVDTPVLTVDLAPTLAHLLDVPVPEGVDGEDRTALATTARPRQAVPEPEDGEAGTDPIEGEPVHADAVPGAAAAD